MGEREAGTLESGKEKKKKDHLDHMLQNLAEKCGRTGGRWCINGISKR